MHETPGQLTNPFARQSSGRRFQPATSREQFIPPVIGPKVVAAKRPVEPVKRIQPPYYLSVVSKKEIEKELDSGTMVTADLPVIYRLAMIFASMNRRTSPTLTDVQTALLFRDPEKLERVASGAEEMKTFKFDMDGKPIMDPRKFGEYWKTLAVQALQKWREPENPTHAPSS